jgi:hypothetical protein
MARSTESSLKDMKTWTDRLGHSGLRSFTDADGHLWLEQYMSPEQAKGKPVDHRADIYAVSILCGRKKLQAVPEGGRQHGQRGRAHTGP